MVSPVRRDEEQRVVAEAAVAARRARGSRPRTRRCARARRPRAGSTKAATQRKRAPRAAAGHVAQRRQQLGVVARVVARLAGVARRVHAGRAAERVDLQARVVGERGQPRRGRRLARLRQGVALEGGAVLAQLGVGRDARRSSTSSRPSRSASSGTISRSLPRLRRGDDDLHRRPQRSAARASSASRCSANSVFMPARRQRRPARAYCSAENASFSAVPWTSTKRPSSVMTKFSRPRRASPRRRAGRGAPRRR